MAKDKKKIDLSTIEIEPVTSLDGLDDLAKDEVFSFKGKEWIIPAVSQRTAEKMSAMHDDATRAVDEEDIELAMKFDIQYAHIAMSAGMSKEDADSLMEELRSWPKAVLGRISRFVATSMMGPVEELIQEEKKEEAKK
jgi:hypothetical protein